MSDAGDIYCEEAYALGKMLNHSAWQKGEQKLPRGITGSDIDAGYEHSLGAFGSVPLFDNRGMILFLEFSRHEEKWENIKKGQRWVYEALIRQGPHCAILCRHNVAPESGRKICTRHDVVSFQAMLNDHGVVISALNESNADWQKFVFEWFKNPLRVRRWLLGREAGL
jgi:hypothetical protein